MMSRLFEISPPDGPGHYRKVLRRRAELEMGVKKKKYPALVAFQGYLQKKAPWRVSVPFVKALSEEIPAVAPRVLRDFSKLLSLVKAVAILRHRHRKVDAEGRLVATIEKVRETQGVFRGVEVADSIKAFSGFGAEEEGVRVGATD